MKSIEKTKQAIAKEVRGKVMAWRIKAKAEAMVSRIEDDIADEIGDLVGKLTTDFGEDEAIQSELAGHAFDLIDQTLVGEIKKRLK